MTIHVSLPQELENNVHAQVDSGMYGSASEVVREALRRFFASDDQLSAQEIALIRQTMRARVEAVEQGTAQLVDGESYFNSRIDRLSD